MHQHSVEGTLANTYSVYKISRRLDVCVDDLRGDDPTCWIFDGLRCNLYWQKPEGERTYPLDQVCSVTLKISWWAE